MEWIVTRTLRDELSNEVTVALAAPYAVGSAEWVCPYRVSLVASGEDILYAHGHDGLQALLLALKFIHLSLHTSGLSLTWNGGEPGDTGIPRMPTMAGGLSLRLRIEKMIAAEEESWGAALAARYKKSR